MFRTILVSAVTVLQLYVLWGAATAPAVTRLVPRAVVLGVGVALWLGELLLLSAGHGAGSGFAAALEPVAMAWLGALFLTAVCLLAADAVTVVGRWVLRLQWLPPLRGWALAAGVVLTGVALVQGHRTPVVRDYAVPVNGLPAALDGTTLVAVADVHLDGPDDAPRLQALLGRTQGLRPDLIVLLGDLFEGHGGPAPELLAILGQLHARLGVWGVAGNHDRFLARPDGVELARRLGIEMLVDRSVEIAPGLVLAGVGEARSRWSSDQRGSSAAAALAGRPPGATILLSHTPWDTETAAAAGVGLMLSGHTHGGQLWPFGYVIGRLYPLLAGHYDVAGMTVIVNRGAGTWGPRMRLWRPGEIVRVTLRSAES